MHFRKTLSANPFRIHSHQPFQQPLAKSTLPNHFNKRLHYVSRRALSPSTINSEIHLSSILSKSTLPSLFSNRLHYVCLRALSTTPHISIIDLWNLLLFSSLRRHFPHLIFPCTESVENNADLLSIFHKLYICQSIYVESGLSQGPIFIDFPRIIYLSIRSCGIYGNDNSGRRAGRRTSATKNLPPTCRHCRHFMNLQKMSSVGSFGVF